MLGDDGFPATEGDFDALFDRLGAIPGVDYGSDIVLTEDELDELFNNMYDGDDFSIEINGKEYDNYADLVELEKDSRVSQITELMSEVTKLETIVEENEEFFENEFDKEEDQLFGLLDDMAEEGGDLEEIKRMIEE